MASVPAFMLDQFVLDVQSSGGFNPPYGTVIATGGVTAPYSRIGAYQTSPSYDNTIISFSGSAPSPTSPTIDVTGEPSSFTSTGTATSVTVDHDANGPSTYLGAPIVDFVLNYDYTHRAFGRIYCPTFGVSGATRSGRDYDFAVGGQIGACYNSFSIPSTFGTYGYELFDTEIEVEWDGTTETFPVTPYVGGGNVINYSTTISRTFTGDDNAIRMRVVDEHSQASPWITVKVPPVAVMDLISDDDDIFIYDVTPSFDVDGVIVSYTPNLIGTYSSGTATWDYEETGLSISANQSKTLRITVTDDDGLTDYTEEVVTVIPLSSRTDMADLPSKAVYVLAKSGADLVLAFYPEGQSSRSIVYTFANCRQPSLYVKADSSLVAGMDNGTNFVLKRSLDRGATWSDMATIFASATYHKAAVTNLLNGGAAAVAIKRSTSPVEVYALVTPNDASWPSTPVLVDTTTSTATSFSILQKKASGSIRLVISNGIDELWQSDNSGVSWTAV